MRALYEINQDLEALLSNIDEETGEVIIDPEALDALLMEREQKLEGIALAIKNITAESAAIKAEEDALKERRERLTRKKDGLTAYLQTALDGAKFETPKVAVSWRKSRSVEIDDAVFWENPAECFVRYGKPTANKDAIKAALKDGGIVPGAALVEKVSMSIK